MKGLWLAFEGVDACGKSTQAARLVDHTGGLATREPGGTETGRAIRSVVLDPSWTVDPRTETLLMAADRAQHVAELVGPALSEGRTVISDRSVASSLAYQGFGRGLGAAEVERINRWALGDAWPDVFVYLRCSRAERARRSGDDLDRIEAADNEFFDRVAQGFEDLAKADPDRWCVVDAIGSVDEVFGLVVEALADKGHRW